MNEASVAVCVKGKQYYRSASYNIAEPTYKKDIIDPIKRYSEKNTPVSRGYVPPGGWDEPFIESLVTVIGDNGAIPRDDSGYTQEDLALRIAGFHGAMATNCHTGNWTRPKLSNDLGCFYDWNGFWSPSNIGLPWKPQKVSKTPEYLSENIKEAAIFLGANIVGIAKLDYNWVYKPGWKRYEHEEIDLDEEIPPSIDFAIVLAVETDYEYVREAPTAKASAAAGKGYSKMALLASSLAKYIAAMGYTAIACGNDTALSIPLAVDAGLGQLGRAGYLITPEFGPRVRICKVLTDMPLVATAPIDFGVTEFCQDCKKCARYCPAQAISYDDRTIEARTVSTNPGILKWPLHGERCLRYWYRNGSINENGMFHIDCYQCVNVCFFNQKPGFYNNLTRMAVKNIPALNKILIKIDEALFKPKYRTGVNRKDL